MDHVEITIDGSSVTIDYSKRDLNITTLEARTKEILPLLNALLSADCVWNALSEEQVEHRIHGRLAMQLVYQISLAATTKQAKLIELVSSGIESAADHGFPEFESDCSVNV